MSIELNSEIGSYLSGFEEFKKKDIFSGIGEISELRKNAINKFTELGYPTMRDEDWRFTNLTPVSKANFKINDNGINIDPVMLKTFLIKDLETFLLVFINGRFSKELSQIEQIPEGVTITTLSEAKDVKKEVLSEYFGKFLDFETEAFNALNTAFFEDGIFIHVPDSISVNKPVHALYISHEDEQSMVNSRNLIVVGKNSGLKVIEHYVSTSETTYFSNVVSEVSVGENSNMEHFLLEFESKKAFNISTLRVQQEKYSNIKSHSILFGGAIVRNNVHPVLAGEGGNSLINGLYLSNGRQHMDNFMRVEHASPHCDSRQIYNGVLDDNSRGVFHGRIIVHEGAVKTDAKQTNRNLLLSDSAQIDTKPQLEIYNDDVKCTHGATIGQMDENAIFYLQSRGIPKKEAETIMVKGFTGESFSNMSLLPLREYLEKYADSWFLNRTDN